MKTLVCLFVAVILSSFTGFVNAQVADVTVVVSGIKEVKGKIMIAMGDQSKPSEMKYDMVEVTSTDNVIWVLKDVPVGKTNLYVYQDVNGNYQLDKDENQVPIELCFVKEKISVQESGNKFDAKLMNVKEMMGGEK